MKRVLGLDLGVTSIGWALVNEAENGEETSSIVKLGVRVNPLTTDETDNFKKGKSITTNAVRTLKRTTRRNLQRYKLRRDALVELLKANGFVANSDCLAEHGNFTTFQTYRLRAKAATECISLEELARVLLMINKKRGYKSNRRANSRDEGQVIDGMDVANELYANGLTPGQHALALMQKQSKHLPDYYFSDLKDEFDRVWKFQQTFRPELLTAACRDAILGKSRKAVLSHFASVHGLAPIEFKADERRLKGLHLRVVALSKVLSAEELVYTLAELCGLMAGANNYLGKISDRSKELQINKITVGQYLMKIIDENPHEPLKKKVFYRRDYLDEFETIWHKQAAFHPELTPELKKQIGSVIIFYQRPLKSQKDKVGVCELESREIEVGDEDAKRRIVVGPKVCPKSSPLFQEFKIWQGLNDLRVTEKRSQERFALSNEDKLLLAEELSVKKKLSKTEILKVLSLSPRAYDLNFSSLEGNKTLSAIYEAYLKILELTGHNVENFEKLSARNIKSAVRRVFEILNFKTDMLDADFSSHSGRLDEVPLYRLWHLLYSFESDSSATGDKKLIEKVKEMFNFDSDECARAIVSVNFPADYGNLSAKAIAKLLPHMREGNDYSTACAYADYKHSKQSLTREELDRKVLVDTLEILPRNSLRNPVVEKILNQMIHVVNEVFATYGKPDEIRIELARELKNSAEERERLTKSLNDSTRLNEGIVKLLQSEFHIERPTRNDILRYRLYEELKFNGYKTLYSNTNIEHKDLFSLKFDIEHIIPQARLFDDSFSNKTLEARAVNQEKGDATAFDYVLSKYGEVEVSQYRARIDDLLEKGAISKTKWNKLMMKGADIPEDFIERDLRNTQYISRKAREILLSCVRTVVATTGTITDRLREDWQLTEVMRELNWDKYAAVGRTESFRDKNGNLRRRIIDWTKRNDHRHHAMDALTIAFTKQSYIQYLNNLNARSDKSGVIYAIEQQELERHNGHLLFRVPLPNFRAEAKRQLMDVLVSFKSKSKVVTRNVNKSKSTGGKINKKVQLTPRGQLHNETVYGRRLRYATQFERVNAAFAEEKIMTVANRREREALLTRLRANGNDAKKAFTGKNALDKNPIWLDDNQTRAVGLRVKTICQDNIYTIRKSIDKDLKIEKVVDVKVRRLLQERLDEYGGDAARAFSNLDEHPIWLNEAKGISIKSVAVNAGLSKPEPLHTKKNHHGIDILNEDGAKQAADYVQTSNNHHVAIFSDAEGKLREHIVSFYEATARAIQGYPVIDRDYNADMGWKFLFTMKQNEYFVFPGEDFNPNDIDLKDPRNAALISPHLFRVQKISSGDYYFRHHLETNVEEEKSLRGKTWERIQAIGKLSGIVKVRVNHIGQIVDVGEY